MADPTALPYQEASTGIDDQKRRQLSAMAAGGTAAKQQITDAQARITADKQRAIDQALTESRQFNAPADVQQNVSARIASPYEQRVTSLTQGQANREADEAYRQGGANDFFSRLTAGIPLAQIHAKSLYDQAVQRVEAAKQAAVAKQQMEIQIAQMKMAADEAARKQVSDLAERRFTQQSDLSERKFEQQMKLQAARDAASASRSSRSGAGGGGGGGGGSAPKTYLGLGLGNAGESQVQLEALVNQIGGKLGFQKAGQSQPKGGGVNAILRGIGTGAKLGSTLGPAKNTAAGALDTQFGLPQGTIHAALPESAFKTVEPKPAPKPAAPSGEAVYSGVKALIADLSSGAYDGQKHSKKDIVAFIRSNVAGGTSGDADKAMRDAGVI